MLRLVLLIVTACGGHATPLGPSAPPVVDPTPTLAPDAGIEHPGAVTAAAPDVTPRPASPSPPREIHRILSIQLAGVELELVVEGGARDGIKKDWSATLVDASDHAVDARLRIVAVSDDRTIVRARATRDQVQDKRVRLSPPAN